MMPCTALGVTAVTTPTTTADYGNDHATTIVMTIQQSIYDH
jgi:hypothetical protein